jgi:hypothetical protein
MENIFFLILVGVVGLLRLVMQAAEKKRNSGAAKRSGTPGANAPLPRAPAQSEEERIRKFFEALGVPTSADPPPKVRPREVTPKTPRTKRPILPVDPFPRPRTVLPPVAQAPPVVPSFPPVEAAEPTPPPQSPAVVQETGSAISQAEIAPATFEVSHLEERKAGGTSSVPPDLIARLRTPEGLRDAVVLREIFGPPRSRQPLAHSMTR